jgi:hypothetical protein
LHIMIFSSTQSSHPDLKSRPSSITPTQIFDWWYRRAAAF